MTRENIANGDPFGVYKDNSPFNMFMRIAFNNIRVSFLTFMGGFTLGYFTLSLMWSNGIMLGSSSTCFFSWVRRPIHTGDLDPWYDRDILYHHCGSSRFCTGSQRHLFPGTYTRMASFRRGARDAAKILISPDSFSLVAAFSGKLYYTPDEPDL